MKPDVSILPAPDRSTEKRVPLTVKQRAQLALDQNGRCGCGCGEKLEHAREGTIDEHIVALALGGTNALSNRAIWRKPCSTVKTAMDMAFIARAKRLAGETCQGRTRPQVGGKGLWLHQPQAGRNRRPDPQGCSRGCCRQRRRQGPRPLSRGESLMVGVHSGQEASVPGGDEAGGAVKRFTLVFEGDIHAVRGPIFRTVEPFGKVVGAQTDDAFEQCCELEETRDTLADAVRGLLACFPAAGRTREQMDAFMQAQKALALTYDEAGA